jgi:uncharacterized protein YndB with AHSA1/START domain
MNKLQLRYVIVIAASKERIWKALTEPQWVKWYYYGMDLVTNWRKGNKIEYRNIDKTVIAGKILDKKKNQKIVHSFQFTDQKDPPSRVTFEIEPLSNTLCWLKVTHDRFKKRTKTYRDCEDGWIPILFDLKSVLETGKRLPWPKL